MAAKASPTKKKNKGKTQKKAATGATSNATLLAIEDLAPAIDCRRCVIRTIEAHCQTTVGDRTDKLRDLCSPCDIGVMADLADELKAKCGASAGLQLDCSMSVLQVISLVCKI
jgi:hypothetical protein